MEFSSSLVQLIEDLDKKLPNYDKNREKYLDLMHDIALQVARKAGKSYQEIFTKTKKDFKKVDKALKEQYKAEVEYEARKLVYRNKISKSTDKFSEVTNQATESFIKASELFTENQKPLGSVLDTLSKLPGIAGGIATIAAMGVGVLDNLIDNYATLARVGIQASGGIMGAAEASVRMGLGLQESADLFSKHALLVQTVGLGAISDFAYNLRRSSPELLAMGMSVQEVTRNSVRYLDIQRNIDANSVRDIAGREESFKNQMKSFYKVTQQMGIGIERIMDEYEKASDDPALRLLLMRLPEKSAEALMALKAAAPQVADRLIQALQRGGNVARIDDFGELLRTGTADEMQRMIDMLEGGESDFGDIMSVIAENQGEYERQFGILSEQMLTDSAGFVAELASLGNRYNEFPEQFSEASDAMTQGLLEAQANMQNAANQAQLNVLEGLQQFLEEIKSEDGEGGSILSGLGDVTETISDFIANPGNFDFFGGLGNLATALKESEVLKTMFGENSPWYAALIGGMGVTFLTLHNNPLVRGLISDAFKSLGSSIVDLISSIPFEMPDMGFGESSGGGGGGETGKKPKGSRTSRKLRILVRRLSKKLNFFNTFMRGIGPRISGLLRPILGWFSSSGVFRNLLDIFTRMTGSIKTLVSSALRLSSEAMRSVANSTRLLSGATSATTASTAGTAGISRAARLRGMLPKGAGALAAAVEVGVAGVEIYDITEQREQGLITADEQVQGIVEAGSGAAGAIAGASTGAMAGAALGTAIFPVVGTFVGGVIGGAVGGFAGWWAGRKAGVAGAEALGYNEVDDYMEGLRELSELRQKLSIMTVDDEGGLFSQSYDSVLADIRAIEQRFNIQPDQEVDYEGLGRLVSTMLDDQGNTVQVTSDQFIDTVQEAMEQLNITRDQAILVLEDPEHTITGNRKERADWVRTRGQMRAELLQIIQQRNAEIGRYILATQEQIRATEDVRDAIK